MKHDVKNTNREKSGNLFKYKPPWYADTRQQTVKTSYKERDVFKVKLCVKCDNVWEFTSYNKDKIRKYKNFPKYKLEKENCINCF